MSHIIYIRQALLEDIPALEHIKPVFEEGYFARCLQEQEGGKRAVFLAERDGLAAGYTIYNRRPQYALYKRLEIPEIQDLNVLPEYRREGIGTALIRHCEDLAQQEGHRHIGISVGLYKDYGAAQRLYTRLGYIPDGNGVTYDREAVTAGELRPVDDNLCLMMVKNLP